MDNKKVKDFFFKNMAYVLIVFVIIAFVFLGQVVFPEVEKSIFDMVKDGLLLIIISFIVTFLFDIQGINRGYGSTNYTEAYEKHNELKDEVLPIQVNMQDFCDEQNAVNLKKIRTSILGVPGLKYDDCFLEDGTAKDDVVFDVGKLWWIGYIYPKRLIWWNEKLQKSWQERKQELAKLKKLAEKKCAFKKARKANPTKLTVKKLLLNIYKEKDKYNYGNSPEQKMAKNSIANLVTKLTMAIIFGYYSYPLIVNWNMGLFIWSCVQAVFMVAMGFFQMYRSYLFIKTRYTSQINEIIGELSIFKSKYMPKHEEERKTIEDEVKRIIAENYGVEEQVPENAKQV